MPDSLLNGKLLSIPNGNLPFGNGRYDCGMDKNRAADIRFKNFNELLKRYGGSPTRFCEETGYDNTTMISQLKGRKRPFGAVLARKLERFAKLEKFSLEDEHGLDTQPSTLSIEPENWPFSIPLAEILVLQGRHLREIDEALTKLVVGAQTQQLLSKQRKHGNQ